jgi:hypothetical protein
MQLKTLFLGAGLALALAGPAAAQTVDGASVDEILAIAKTYGSATLASQSNGDPKVSGQIEGIPYTVYFMNCTNNADCEDVNFYSGFLDNKPDLETINAWNRDKRFGKAYLDTDLDAVVEWDVNLEHGVTSENMDAAFALWWLILDQYTTYIGAK